jgi:hypothetical protein
LKIANRQEDAFRFTATALPVFAKASGERGLLLVGLKLCQQLSVPDANLLGIKGIDDRSGEVGELETGGHIGWLMTSGVPTLAD